MMSSDKASEAFDRIADALVHDLLSLTEADLVADTTEAGYAPEIEASAARATIARALIKVAHPLRPQSRVGESRSPDAVLSERMRTLLSHLANDNGARPPLTLAAREGGQLSAGELADIMRELQALGAFGDDP